MKRVAVILCGSGFKDGSEIRESVGVLWALSEEKAETAIFALDEPQSDVVNCLSGEIVSGEKRNQLVEAARIARGNVRPLSELKAAEFDALVIPGGYGAAKNLCTFAKEGGAGKVHPLVQKKLEEFQGKAIGAVCIAPILLAMAFKGKGFELTLGGKSEASAELEKLGHNHVEKKASEWHVDKKHKLVTTPAYMHDSAPLSEIFQGIRGMAAELIRLA